MNEIWKDIEGYEGLYMVSDLGRVKSLGNGKSNNSKERILKPGKNRYGYLYVIICKESNKKMLTVHRLVAKAFIPNPENKPEVGHKDDDKTNNSVANLYWTDHKSNCNYGTRNEKISKKVLCVETNTVYKSAQEAQIQTGIFQPNITSCCQGKRKTAGKLHWQYAELTNS